MVTHYQNQLNFQQSENIMIYYPWAPDREKRIIKKTTSLEARIEEQNKNSQLRRPIEDLLSEINNDNKRCKPLYIKKKNLPTIGEWERVKMMRINNDPLIQGGKQS